MIDVCLGTGFAEAVQPVSGRPIRAEKAHRIARARLAFVPEDPRVFPDHTVENNLAIAAKAGCRVASADKETKRRYLSV